MNPLNLQGQPLSHGPRSTKITGDPEAHRDPIDEPAGPVPNDSLAAESAIHGGAFAQNRGSVPMGANASETGMNTTNTFGSTKLPPAPVAGIREDRQTKERYPEVLGGQGDYPGPHLPESGYVGGPTGAKQELAAEHDAASYRDKGPEYRSRYNAGQAPSYVADVIDVAGQGKPKGKNLQEGDIPEDAYRNASSNTEIGTTKDPGRTGVSGFQYRAAGTGLHTANGPKEHGIDNRHPYQTLGADENP